jgi:hypothetical protein
MKHFAQKPHWIKPGPNLYRRWQSESESTDYNEFSHWFVGMYRRAERTGTIWCLLCCASVILNVYLLTR